MVRLHRSEIGLNVTTPVVTSRAAVSNSAAAAAQSDHHGNVWNDVGIPVNARLLAKRSLAAWMTVP